MSNLASLILKVGIDEHSIAKVAQKCENTAENIQKEFNEKLGKLDIDKGLQQGLYKSLDSISGEFKNLDLSSIKENFLNDFINSNDLEEQQKILENFVETITLLKNVTKNYSLKMFEGLDSSEIEKLVDLQQKVEDGAINASSNLYNYIKPLLSQLKTAQQMYDKIKDMSGYEVNSRLNRLGDLAGGKNADNALKNLDNKQLREFIVLYEKAQNMLENGLDIKIKNADSLQDIYNKAISRYNSNGSDWLKGYNSIQFADELEEKLAVKNEVAVKVVPDVTNFKAEAEAAINELNVTGNAILTPVANDEFNAKAKQLAENSGATGNVTLNPALASKFKSTTTQLVKEANLTGSINLEPKLSDTFVSDIKAKIEKKNISPDLNISPKLTSKATSSISSSVDSSLKNTESISSKIDSTVTSADNLAESLGKAKESTTEITNAIKEAIKQAKKLNESLGKTEKFEGLSSLTDFFNSIKIDENLGNQLKTIADDLKDFAESVNGLDQDSAAGISVVLETIKKSGLTEKQLQNFQQLPTVIQSIYEAINKSSLPVNDNVKPFLDYLTEILQKSKELQNFATIVSKVKSENLKTSSLVSGTEDSEALERALTLYKNMTQYQKQRVNAEGELASIIDDALQSDEDTVDALSKQIAASTLLTEQQKEQFLIAQDNYEIAKAAANVANGGNSKANTEESSDSDAKKKLEDLDKILESTEAEYQRVIDVASGKTDWFGEPIKQGKNLLETLGQVSKIVKTLSRDENGNVKSLKYTITGTNGTQTIDATKDVQNYKGAIIDATAALKLFETTSNTVKLAEQNSADYASSYNFLVQKLKEANEQLEAFIEAHTDSNNVVKITNQEAEAYNELVKAVQNANSELNNAWQGSSQKERDNLLTSINNWEKNNSKGSSLYSNELKAIKSALSTLGADADVDKLNSAFTEITASIHEAGLEGQSFGDLLSGQLTSKIASFVATFLSIQDIIRYVQEAVSVIEDLDYALLDLSKTADMTAEQLDDFYYSANQSAQELGVSTEEIINLASSWSRLGYNTAEEATNMAEMTAKFAAISPGMTTDEASSGLISIMKAWDLSVDEMEDVMDKINVLGNNFALENGDVTDAMQDCAAALSTMGTSYQDAFALFTGAQEIMQDADKVGNGLKSVAMRIRGYSEDAESGGYVVDETLQNISGDLIELTKVASDPVLKNGISVYTDDTKYLDEADKKYKSLVEYLGEIADNWDKFSETQQTQLLQKLFAKTQASTGAAIIENFGQVREALNQMESSAGSADAEMSKVEETITFKLNKLKEVWTGFLQTAASKELIKTIIDGLTSISEAIIKVLETPGLNVAAITGLAAAILKLFKNATNPAREFLAVLKSLTGESSKLNKATTSASVFAKIASMMSGSSKLTGTASAAENAINVAVNTEDGVEALELLATASEGATVAVTATGAAATVTSAEVAATSAAETANSGIVSILSAKYTALASSMGMSAGVFTAVWGTAIVAAVATAAHFYKVYKQESEYVENLNSEVEDLTETFTTNSSEIQSTINSINSVSDKYQKLAKGVDQYGNNVSLSNDDFEEYNEISNQIADTFPELVSGYSDTGTAILECKDDIELLNKACENKAFESYAELLSGDNMSKLGKSIGIAYNGYESDVFKIKTAGTEQQKEDLKSFEKELNNFQSIIKEAKTNGYTLNSILSTHDTISAGGVVDNDAYSYYLKLNKVLKQITAYGKEFNIDTSGIKLDYSVSEDTLDTVIDGIVSRFNVAESSIEDSEEEAEENFGLMVDGILHSSEKFSTLDDTSLENLKKFLTSTADIQGMINPDTNELEESTLRQWIDNLVEDGSWNKIENKINELFSFNSDSYDTLGEAQDALDKILAELAEYLDEDENELKIKLGFDTLDSSLDKMVAAALQGTDVEKAYKEQSSSDLDHEIENYARQITEAENKFQEAIAKRKEKYSSSNIVGNVDLNNRNVVAGVTMKAAGWEGDENTYSTIDTVTETLENIADESGETAFVVNVTPILPNGQVLTQESFQEYMNYLAQHATSADAILEADKTENGGYGLILDSNDTVTGEDGKQQVITWDNVSAAIDEASVAAEGYHNEQAGIYDEEGSALLDETNLIQKKNEKIQESTNATEAYNQAQTKAAEELSNNKWSSDKEQAFLEFCTEAGDKYSDFTEKVKAFEQQYSDTMATAFSNESFATEIENFSKVNEAYQKVAENIKKGKIGTEIASDIKDVEELRDLFQDISDYGDFDSFNEIETVLTSGASTAEQVQEAWDSLATSFWNAKLAAGGYSEETQKLISTQLQANGVTKEAADTYVKSLTTLATAKDVCTQAGKDITEMSDAEILAFALEANESAFTKDQLLLLEIAKYACNQAEINTVSDIEQLENLMTSAGATTLQLKSLASAKAAVAAGDALTLKAENATNAADEQKYYQLAQKQYDRGKAEGQKTAADFINEYKSTMVGLGYQPTGASSGSGSGSSKDSDSDEDKWVKKYEEEYDELKDLRENNKIDEYDYIQYLRALYYKYYKDKEKYVENFEKAESEYLNSMKELYEDVFSDLSSLIDDQISELQDAESKATDALETQKTAATNALKAEKKAAVANIQAQIDALKDQQDAIQDQIDAYQDEIDAINDANDAREREITLQKALYELDNLNSQRTNLVYSESQGMHYEADLSGIRDARESVQDAKDDIEIANLEKKIDLLEDEKDALDDLIDDLEDQKDAIEDYYDNLIDESEAYYDNLIAETKASYEAQIEALENAQDSIEKFQKDIEKAELATKLAKMTGQSIDEILNGLTSGDETVLNKLKDEYYSVIKDMYSGNQEVLNQFSQITGCDFSSMTGFLEATESAFKGIENTNFDVVKNGITDLQNAFKSLDDQIAVSNLFGENSSLAEQGKKAAEEAGKAYVGNLTAFFQSSEELKTAGKDAATATTNAIKEEVTSGESKETITDTGENITKGVSEGMTTDDAKASIQEKATEVAESTVEALKSDEAFGIHSPSQLVADEVGKYVAEAIPQGALDAMNGGDSEFSSLVQQLAQEFVNKLKEAFDKLDTSNMIDFNKLFGFATDAAEDAGEESTTITSIFDQLVQDIAELNDQFAKLDMTNVVTSFEDLKDAITGAAEALGGGEGGMSESTGEGSEGGNTSGGKSKSSSSNSGSEGSLISAMETLGTTAEDVLGGGEEGEGDGEEGGSGIIGKFATLKTKVQDVTAAIGLGDEEEGGGSGAEEEGGTLISAFEAEKKTFFDEEQGLPKQLDSWEQVAGAIEGCVTAVKSLKEALEDLYEFSIHVSFGGSGGEAEGTFGFADGSFNVVTHGYAGGKVGLEQDQRAVVSEQGVEGLVRNGRFQLIGQHGAEMMNLKKGDIIFSHAQTMALLKNGKINSRGKTIGNKAYADGTPFNKALSFAGKDLSSSALTAIANQLTGTMLPMESNIEAINRNVADMAASVSNISSVNNTSNVTIGDIHVTGVQDVDGFAKAIKSYLPGKMTQALYK